MSADFAGTEVNDTAWCVEYFRIGVEIPRQYGYQSISFGDAYATGDPDGV